MARRHPARPPRPGVKRPTGRTEMAYRTTHRSAGGPP
jgi:hypothetical protein